VYISAETRYSLDGMSNLVPHVPDPAFWKKYYTDQAKGKMYARANPGHRTVGQRGSGGKKGVATVIQTISPLQQTYDRARSQIKRRLGEVGGASAKKSKTIKGKGQAGGLSRAKSKRRGKKSAKKQAKGLGEKKRDIFL